MSFHERKAGYLLIQSEARDTATVLEDSRFTSDVNTSQV